MILNTLKWAAKLWMMRAVVLAGRTDETRGPNFTPEQQLKFDGLGSAGNICK